MHDEIRKEVRYVMNSVKIFVPYGAVGIGCTDEAFEAGLAMGPDIICSDAGSTDSGPYYLGTGTGKYSISAVKRDLKKMVLGAHRLGVPMAIGSAGTCGSDQGVDEAVSIIEEILQENHITGKKIAKIYSEQGPAMMKQKYLEGKVTALKGAPEISEKTFDECEHIVGLAGAEPFMEAFRQGADIIVCGRSTDTAIMAFYPLMNGCDPASSWHAAKILECGGLCTSAGAYGGAFAEVDEKGFTIRSVAKGSTVSPYSVSAHLLYENADPIHLTEPGVRIDTEHSVYTAVDEKSVRVEGTKITYHPYTMKLEGSGKTGYQTISLVGIRDRDIMKEPECWMSMVEEEGLRSLDKAGIDPGSYHVSLRAYGYNAVSGMPVPEGYVPNELGILLTVTADTPELSLQIAKAFNPLLLHQPFHPEKQMPSFGFPFSPAEVQRGLIYEFKLYHTVSLDDPLELVRFVYEEV